MISGSNPKDVVTSFLEALNNKDLDSARGYLADNVSFMATDGAPVYGAEAYMNGWKKLGINYGISKAFVEGDDACILYDSKIQQTTSNNCRMWTVPRDW